MKIFIAFIFVFVSLFVIIIFNRSFQSHNIYSFNNDSLEYYKYYNSIYTMNYQQLSEMHNKLLELQSYSLHTESIIDDIYSINRLSFSAKETDIELDRRLNNLIPIEKQIYGCVTYSDAERLNSAIVRQMNLLMHSRK